MTGIPGQIKNIFTVNLAYKVASLVAAMLVWVWVQNEQVITERVRVRLEWQLPEGLLPMEKPLEAASINLEGVQIAIRGARQKELTMQLDLREAHSGEIQLDLSNHTIQGLPPQVRVVSISPATLVMKLERALERKLAIKPSPMGAPAPGFVVSALEIEPKRVELMGPISLLRNLEEITTEPIEIAGLSEDANLKVGLDLPAGVRVLGPSTISVHVDVQEVQVSRKLSNVTVQADRLKSTAPVEVIISGPQRMVEELDPESVRIQVEVPERLTGRSFRASPGAGTGLRYQVIVPDDQIKVEKVEPERIILVRSN